MSNHSPENPWKDTLAYLTAGFIFFETLSGLAIYFLPFSVANQIMILIHVLVGFIFLIPFAWYQFKHWLNYRKRSMSDVKLTGYLSMIAVMVAIVSGMFLTWQAAIETRISYLWKNIHLVSTFVLLATMLPHILLIVVRNLKARGNSAMEPRLKGQKSYGFNSLYLVAIQFAVVGLFMFAYEPPDLQQDFPEGYEFPHGEDNPFAPSMARTSTGGVLDPDLLSGSQSCGTAGCHEQITEEWEASAHRYAAADPFFRAVQEAMGKEKGAASTRYCAGCHDPISLFAGTKNLYSDNLTNKTGLHEGVSCVSCHSIRQIDERGNADYEIEEPVRYMFEMEDGKAAKWISDFLIRSYPEKHVETFDKSVFKTSEFCSSCHKQFLDERINGVGWVQLQNQFDPWKESHWYTEGDKTVSIECRECHMPLVDSQDPARGDAFDYNRSPDDKEHRSHRFLGANQFVPQILELPNAKEHVELVEKWLRGEIAVPEISDKWVSGPAVPIQIIAPDSIEAGTELPLNVLITNKKAGHDFPTGPLDIIQSWLEVTATDQNGTILFRSGYLDDEHFIEPGSFIFRAEPVDQYNNPIDRHNLWDMVGVRYSRALFPGKSDYARFSFTVPDENGGGKAHQLAEYNLDAIGEEVTDIYVTTKLQYRKINQFLMKATFSDILDVPTSPVTTLSEDEKHIKVVKRSPS